MKKFTTHFFLLFFCLSMSLTPCFSQRILGIVVDEFRVPPNKIDFDATRLIEDHLYAAEVAIIDHDFINEMEDNNLSYQKFTLSARFAESNMLSQYGYLIVEIIDEQEYPFWRYTSPIKGMAKFGMSERGSTKTKQALISLLDEFIEEYNLYTQHGYANRVRKYDKNTSSDDSLRTYRYYDNADNRYWRRPVRRLEFDMHKAIIEDSLYLYEGKWIPIEDVPLKELASKNISTNDGTLQVANNIKYQPSMSTWLPINIENYYVNNSTLPIESYYVNVKRPSQKIAIIAENNQYSIIITESQSPNWIPGSLKGGFIDYKILRPFDVTWITDDGEVLETTCTIDNKGILIIQLGKDKMEVYKMVRE